MELLGKHAISGLVSLNSFLELINSTAKLPSKNMISESKNLAVTIFEAFSSSRVDRQADYSHLLCGLSILTPSSVGDKIMVILLKKKCF